ncbi:PRC-barrel domain-containing protein [Peribacillus glennii]|uniref:Photosystem reaction center subunit H n=1 Tax=Peribacillus glennii TaxID=2303991 RepID=A0A372LJI5_9BACI|nr:PRC-barrel domain-containing protein [Peribacillus glennii]RFU66102.1 photosystem reaction center subunit H [Peribacillus glennii]
MKKSAEILGFPIISISEGQEIGTVKTLVINPEKGSVEFLTIEHEDWQGSVKAIPFKKVIGIGEYAVTVESENSVIDLNEIPIANQLVNKKIKITDAKVITRKGQLLGSVLEYFIDDENGNVIGMLIKLKEKEIVLPSETVLTYGKDILIVTEDASEHFLESAEQLVNQIPEEETANDDERVLKESADLKEKQVELLNGKKLLKDFADREGNVLFSGGTVLTEDDIRRAQQERQGVIGGLSMNVEA